MRTLLVSILALCLFIFTGCGSASDTDESALPDAEEPEEVEDGEVAGPLMGKVDSSLAIDGSSAGYPAGVIQAVETDIYLAYDDSNIYVHLETEGEGWVSVGFNSEGGLFD